MLLHPRISTGLSNLDDILGGGFPAQRLFLIEGTPGSGKTTLGLQFLMEGRRLGEKVLYITLSETVAELNEVAIGHGWDLQDIELFEWKESELGFTFDAEQSILHPWEVELTEVVKVIMTQVDRIFPSRIVFDSLSELRLLAQDSLRFRRQILALKQFFSSRNVTVLLMDDLTGRTGQNVDLHSISHGVITLERLTLDFGVSRRRLQVQKLRGSAFREGYHDFRIKKGGAHVFPRLVALEHFKSFVGEPLLSGLRELDELLGGGPLRGTCTLLTGPAGCGKTTIALQYLVAACKRGERCVIYEFDERIGTMLVRARGIGLNLDPYIENKTLIVRQIDPSEMSPGEFANSVKNEVIKNNTRLIVIDSLNGYMTAMPQEKELVLQIHEVLSYLNQQGVATFLIALQHGLVGTMATGSLNISYISDAIILLRFFESEGRVRKALSILKNRGSAHEDTIRELMITSEGLRLSAPLTEFSGILTGTPVYRGAEGTLLPGIAHSK